VLISSRQLLAFPSRLATDQSSHDRTLSQVFLSRPSQVSPWVSSYNASKSVSGAIEVGPSLVDGPSRCTTRRTFTLSLVYRITKRTGCTTYLRRDTTYIQKRHIQEYRLGFPVSPLPLSTFCLRAAKSHRNGTPYS